MLRLLFSDDKVAIFLESNAMIIFLHLQFVLELAIFSPSFGAKKIPKYLTNDIGPLL
jgi:hypothetical protein